MDDKHRSEKLDVLIGSRVDITFRDGERLTGVLGYDDLYRIGRYYIQTWRGTIYFRKSHVARIREEGGAK